MKRTIFGVLLAAVTLSAHALDLAALSNKDAAGGLKEALVQGASKAVADLGRNDGFMGNPKVQIPLPAGVEKVESVLRMVGAGKYADELKVTMNRAAESAVVEAKPLLVNAIKTMSVQDAKDILSGGDDAATQYFRRTTAEPLTAKFKPIVQKSMARVKLTEKYDQLADKASRAGLVDSKNAHLDDYVTQKALDGLFLMIAEEEKNIRKDPVSAAGKLAQKVFGSL